MRWVRSDDAGAVAVITAIVSVVLFGVAALTVDIGRMWETRRQAQSDSDLAALAGALYLPKQPVQACTAALKYLRDNTPGGNAAGSGIASDADCTATGTPDKQVEITNSATRITVTTPQRTINFGLATAIGFSNGHTLATATAEIRSPGTGIEPFFLNSTEVPGVSCLKDANNGNGDALRASLVSLVTPQATVQPVVTKLDPPQGKIAGGDTVTISGSGFDANSAVIVDGKAVQAKNVTFNPATQTQPANITFITPAHAAGQVDVVVRNGTGNSKLDSQPQKFTYLDPALTLTPGMGTSLGGTSVTMTGSFPAGSTVSWAGSALVPVSTNAGSITVLTPPHAAGTVPVMVTNAAMPNMSWQATFTYVTAIYALTLSPSFGSVAGGDTVTLTSVGGPAFNATSQVTWAGQPLASTYSNAKGLTVVTPAHAAGPVNVTVTTSGQTTQPAQFTYNAQSIILTPNVGPTAGGNQVVISTTDAPAFTAGSTVTWDGKPLAATYDSQSKTLTVTAPAQGTSPATVLVTVTTGGTTSLPGDYTYLAVVQPPNDCTSSTGDFGYLDLPRDDGFTPELTYNAMLGMENSGRIIKTVPANGQCPADDSGLDMILDTPATGQSPLKPVVTCLNILTGGKVSQVADGLLQGKGGKPGRLQATHDNQTMTSILGTQVDGDKISKYLTNGMSESQFTAALQGNISLLDSVIDPSIIDCPRFAYVPVLATAINPQNANNYWAIKDFMGSFIKKFDLNTGGTQVTVIEAYVFPLSLLPPTVPVPDDGTIPYIGAGPKIPVLVK